MLANCVEQASGYGEPNIVIFISFALMGLYFVGDMCYSIYLEKTHQ